MLLLVVVLLLVFGVGGPVYGPRYGWPGYAYGGPSVLLLILLILLLLGAFGTPGWTGWRRL